MNGLALEQDLSPLLGGTPPQMDMSVVLLPAPLAPMRVTISPRSICREIPCRAWILP
jgi:hypothetical protein